MTAEAAFRGKGMVTSGARSDPQISVVIPIYNEEDVLPRLHERLLEQRQEREEMRGLALIVALVSFVWIAGERVCALPCE
jgi:cellulose synthase/poly-beta-1,6-N-acetylglucosamine synthase-like glycosyltransferase